MSGKIKLVILAIAVTLILSSGCKDKTEQAAVAKKDDPKNSQPGEPIASAPKPAPETPAVKPIAEKEIPPPPSPVVTAVVNNEKPAENAHAGWTSDYKAAVKKAVAENKDLLLEFTGSNWCPPCMKLYDTVFSRKEFIEAASKDFVLVMLDYPRDKPLAPELDAQNKQLSEKYGIEYFPTIYLTDAQGRPYGKTSFMEVGPKEYLEHLSVFRDKKKKFDELMAKAQSPQADDSQKAKFIDDAIRLLPPELVVSYYRKEIDMIIALDSENKAGLGDRHRVNLVLWEAGKYLSAGNANKAIEMVDKTINELKAQGEMAQEAYFFKAIIFDSKGDKTAVLANLKKAIAAAPETEKAAEIKKIIKEYFPPEKTE